MEDRGLITGFTTEKTRIIRTLTFLHVMFGIVVALGHTVVHAYFPKRIGIRELSQSSDLIVLVKVESVRRSRPSRELWAKAKVLEVWRGRPMQEIEFLAAHETECDLAGPARGETAVLFLTKTLESKYIVKHSGRGRLPIREIGRLTFATYADIEFSNGVEFIRNNDRRSGFTRAIRLDTLKRIVIAK